MDCLFVFHSERCYELVHSSKCYNVSFSIHCQDCNDSKYLDDCTGCSDCYMSVGLQNKSYYILNKEYSKEQYKEKIREIEQNRNKYLKEIQTLKQKSPKRENYNFNSENST